MSTHIVSLIIGIIFGSSIVLAGLANPDRIMNALRLKDLHIVRTIITFLLVALLGIWIIEKLGAGNINNNPAAIVTLTIGGLLVGAGLGFTGYSPCTSLAGAALGRIDAIAAILGMFFGGYIYVLIYPPLVEPLEKLFNYGPVTLPEKTHIAAYVWTIMILIAGSFVLLLTRERKLPGEAKPDSNKIAVTNEEKVIVRTEKSMPIKDIYLQKDDVVNAAHLLHFWKNILFFIIIICILLNQILFWLISRGGMERLNATISSRITILHITIVLNISNTLLILVSVLYTLTIFFCLSASFGAFLGGLRYISRAFFSALIAFVLLFPWQILFKSTVVGAIYSPSELLSDISIDTGQLFFATLFYLRFIGYWVFVVFLLIRSYVYSIRWEKSALGSRDN